MGTGRLCACSREEPSVCPAQRLLQPRACAVGAVGGAVVILGSWKRGPLKPTLQTRFSVCSSPLLLGPSFPLALHPAFCLLACAARTKAQPLFRACGL